METNLQIMLLMLYFMLIIFIILFILLGNFRINKIFTDTTSSPQPTISPIPEVSDTPLKLNMYEVYKTYTYYIGNSHITKLTALFAGLFMLTSLILAIIESRSENEDSFITEDSENEIEAPLIKLDEEENVLAPPEAE